jgi:hypothetical protein
MPVDPMAHFIVERLRGRDVDDGFAARGGLPRGERNRMICLARARTAQNQMSIRHYVRPAARDTD